MTEPEKCHRQMFWSPESLSESQNSDIEVYTVGLWLCFALTVTVPLVIPSWNIFLNFGVLETFDYLKDFWTFR